MLPSHLPVVNLCDILQKWIIERQRDVWSTKMNVQGEKGGRQGRGKRREGRKGGGGKRKVVMLEVKFKSNVSRVTVQIAECRNVDNGTIQETLNMCHSKLVRVNLLT